MASCYPLKLPFYYFGKKKIPDELKNRRNTCTRMISKAIWASWNHLSCPFIKIEQRARPSLIDGWLRNLLKVPV